MGMFDKMFGKNNKDNSGSKKQDGPMISKEEMDRVSNELIKKLELVAGKRISLVKKALDLFGKGGMASFAQVRPGDGLSGELAQNVELGDIIKLTGGNGQTSPIERVYEKDGKYLVKTATSIYEIQNMEQVDEISEKLIKEFGLDVVGKDIKLIKRSIANLTNARIQPGVELSGKLKNPVTLGESINLDSSNTSAVKRVYKEGDKKLIETSSSSVYELM